MFISFLMKIVFIVDTGVNFNHPDLASNMHPSFKTGCNAAACTLAQCQNQNCSSTAADSDGHGSHCSGIIGAVGSNGQGIAGINHGAVKLVGCKFLNPSGYTSDAIECITWW